MTGKRVGEYLAMGLREIGRLEQMVENVLASSRASRGNIEVANQPLLLCPWMGDLLRSASARYPTARITLHGLSSAELISASTCDDGETVDLTVDADPHALRMILDNLIDNAVKYGGAPPEVDISISTKGLVELGGNIVTITVCDNGPGVPIADVERIFERFQRGSDDGVARRKGSGLGLYVARELAQAMGGGLRLENSHCGDAGSVATAEYGDAGCGGGCFSIWLRRIEP